MSSVVGDHVPSASLAGSFTLLPTRLMIGTTTLPPRTVVRVGASIMWASARWVGRNMPVVPSCAATANSTLR
jgi:hypothetical protein